MPIGQSIIAMANGCVDAGSLSMDSNNTGNVDPHTFSVDDLAILQRFLERTVLTVGTKRAGPAYRGVINELAFRVCILLEPFHSSPERFCSLGCRG